MTVALNPTLKPFLNVAEAAKFLRISREKLYGDIRQGLIPAIRLGPRTTRIATSLLMDMAGMSIPAQPIESPKERPKSKKATAPKKPSGLRRRKK
ncbi:helix-turn-helix domain-containing protein [Catellatospora sp. NPDC049111]|uniref:helix-turn-helix domain-containing protein n=1 Tax=Catellatospora sp. NPDC049111 TaxID=3155271 RepID=UPI0033C0A9B2